MVSRKKLYQRKRFSVFACYHCHQLQYCNMFQKTHRCVQCRRTLLLKKINPIFTTDERDQAIRFIKEAKKRIGMSKGWDQFITADKVSN